PAGRSGLAVAIEAAGLELVSPGPDGRPGTGDDVRDPFARVVRAGTPYAAAAGEDDLMRRLACLGVGAGVLEQLQAAFGRLAVEVAEEEIGDAVLGRDAQHALGGLIGNQVGEAYGVGGLGLVGAGHGGGGRGEGTIGLGRLGTIGHGGGGGLAAGFARLVRERFPATLLFAPSVAVDPSGTTIIPVRLPDAITTYLVEAVVWGADGWTWSAATRLRVDQETTVDAPVPRDATVGDVLRLPVRVVNRTSHARDLVVTVSAASDRTHVLAERRINVPGGDAAQVPVELRLTTPGEDRLTVGVLATDGTPLDAVRRPLTVRPLARRARLAAEALVSGAGTVVLEVPGAARAGDVGEVVLRAGPGLFEAPADPGLAAWLEAWSGRAPAPEAPARAAAVNDARPALTIGVAWEDASVSNDVMSATLKRLARRLKDAPLHARAGILLDLAPAARRIGARGKLAPDLEATLRALRAEVETGAAQVLDDPRLLAAAAAALAWTAPERADLGRVRVLVERVRRHEVRVGPFTWIAAPGGEVGEDAEASALLALAQVRLEERTHAFELLRTLHERRVGLEAGGGTPLPLARVAALLLGGGRPPASVTVTIDGRAERVALRGGLARVAAPALARPGRHEIRVAAPEPAGPPAPLHVMAAAEVGLPWSPPPGRRGSLEVAIETAWVRGGFADADPSREVRNPLRVPRVETDPSREARNPRAAAALVLVVRNRSPRVIGAPVLEVSVPAGAEIDETARAALRQARALEQEATRGTLRLVLAALPPGGVRRVPLPLRWSVGGSLHGLGVVSYPDDRPEDVAVLAPRVLAITAAEVLP
ncbi:MAG TPA: alpha-2-macroglobulin family protein, partial [Polyangia bacterium]